MKVAACKAACARGCETRAALPCPSRIDCVFITLLHAYRPHGGLARGEEIERRVSAARGHLHECADELDAGDATLQIEWGGIHWKPMFQFDEAMRLRPQVAQVVRELARVFDPWELALWFVTPNSWLEDRRPVECVVSDRKGTLAAARADRFVAVG